MSRTQIFVVVWLVVCAGLIGVILASAAGHTLWSWSSDVYAQELQAQAALSTARAGEYQGLAISLKELPAVLLNAGAVLVGAGWFTSLFFAGWGLLRCSFAISRVIEVRGGYAPIAIIRGSDTPALLRKINENHKQLDMVDKRVVDGNSVNLPARRSMVTELFDEVTAGLAGDERKPSPVVKSDRHSDHKPVSHSTSPVRAKPRQA